MPLTSGFCPGLLSSSATRGEAIAVRAGGSAAEILPKRARRRAARLIIRFLKLQKTKKQKHCLCLRRLDGRLAHITCNPFTAVSSKTSTHAAAWPSLHRCYARQALVVLVGRP